MNVMNCLYNRVKKLNGCRDECFYLNKSPYTDERLYYLFMDRHESTDDHLEPPVGSLARLSTTKRSASLAALQDLVV